ncbi:methionyl-tRNA formyltransferase [Veillonella seminalis]|uniref:Methionyl-tRNA formyltransferase n=1 Tax=Veillonella seminalis TaxID=1502943 RepID=A0A833CCJ5_9FIRM|nr:methionyl-tRNA formyltransferase [Veillonella seminalis]KAB1479014.1 methionyl-tRNA formyltransferase [Veillonella seminalis]
MNSLRVVFMGTPDFAVPTLEALIKGPHEVVDVFCQPDKQKGRGKKVQMPPVKECALAAELTVYQPETLRDEATETLLRSLAPDVIIVVAYGKILPPWLIRLPKYGCINVHASLLPKYRGAAPIHWAILNGDTHTGVTIMQMDDGLDTGDILDVVKTDIKDGETTGELFDRLAVMGGEVINEILAKAEAGELQPVAQDDDKASHTTKITKEMGAIDWQNSAVNLVNQIRGLNPAPGCFTFLDGKRLKIWQAKALNEADMKGENLSLNTAAGTILAVGEQDFTVATGEGALRVFEVQPDNKKRMTAGDFCRGHQVKAGLIFNA